MDKNPDFKYEAVLKRGRPRHDAMDPFSLRHPPMPLSRRAKLFNPFAALKGYEEALAAKEVPYEPRRELSDEKKTDLDQKIAVLRRLTRHSHAAMENHVIVSVTRFVPCSDPDHEGYGQLGLYETLTGVCMGVDVKNRTLQVDEHLICARDIADIVIADRPV